MLLSLCLNPSEKCFAYSLFDRADSAAEYGRNDEAVELYRQSIASESSTAVAATKRLISLLCKLHRYAEAAQMVQGLISTSNDPAYKTLLARIYIESGNFYQAQGVYQDLLSLDPQNGKLLLAYGDCLEATGNYDAARDIYLKVGTLEGYAYESKRRLSKIKNAKAGSSAGSATAIDPDSVFGRWPLNRVCKLKVAVNDGTGVRGYRSYYKEYVRNAIESWNASLIGVVHLDLVDGNTDKADIVVDWVDRLDPALGVAMPTYFNAHAEDKLLHSCKIRLACNVRSDGGIMPDETAATHDLWEAHARMMQEVALHEFGHALGLNHSGNPTDIMFSGIFAQNSADVVDSRNLSNEDVRRARAIYADQNEALSEKENEGQPENDESVSEEARSAEDPANGPSSGLSNRAVNGHAIVADGAGRLAGRPNKLAAKPAKIAETSLKADLQLAALRDVVCKLHSGEYAACVEQLHAMLAEEPKNAQVHYLLALAFVGLRHYKEASEQYQTVIKMAPAGDLARLAASGLSKIKY